MNDLPELPTDLHTLILSFVVRYLGPIQKINIVYKLNRRFVVQHLDHDIEAVFSGKNIDAKCLNILINILNNLVKFECDIGEFTSDAFIRKLYLNIELGLSTFFKRLKHHTDWHARIPRVYQHGIFINGFMHHLTDYQRRRRLPTHTA